MTDKKNPSVGAKAIVTKLKADFGSLTDPFEFWLIAMAADNLLAKGWNVAEIYHFFSNFEEVDPSKDEDVAIANMKRIELRVEKRLQKVENVS